MRRRIKLICRLVLLELAVLGGFFGLGHQGGDVLLFHWLEGAGGVEGLLQDRHRIAAGDDDARGQAHRVMQAFDGADGVAFEDDAAAHWFHAEHADLFLFQDRQDAALETVEMGVHHVQWHLDGVEPELVGGGGLEHL